MARSKKTTKGGGGAAGGTQQNCVQKGSLLVIAHLVGNSSRPFADGLDLSLVEAVRASGAGGGKPGKTNAEGVKEFTDLPATMHTVTASLTGANADKFELVGQTRATSSVSAGGTTSVNFDVAPFRVLIVKVVLLKPDGTRTPLESIEVLVGTNLTQTTAAGTGVARFEKMKGGKQEVKVKLTEAQSAEYEATQSYQVELATGETQELTIELRPTVPNSVEISKLPRWFLPGMETCEVDYVLKGDGRFADKVDFLVCGSGYCELDDWNKGLPKFKPAPGVPLFQRNFAPALCKEKSTHAYGEWKGQAEASKGVLKAAVGETRHVNVAFSPYIVLLRYYKDAADATSNVLLAPFWPQFAPAGEPKADSLKISYKVENCTKFKEGRLLVWDKNCAVVHEQDLAASDATEGDHSITWNGVTKQGAKIAATGMPYRVQVQLYTNKGTPNAVAIAATHTEVRLYVHPQTPAPEVDPYDPTKDKSSLLFGLAALHSKTPPPTKADGRLWTKYALAGAGFHPGPVNDAATNADFETALNEFQRSVPKARPGGAGDFARLALTAGGNDDADTRGALEKITAEYRRAWFGKSADRTDYDPATAGFRDDLRDPTKELVVWVDDRHWYTDPDWLPDIAPSVRTAVTSHPTALGNRRGGYTVGDARVNHDARDIPRPWLPFQVEFRLLSKTHHLTDVLTDLPDEATLVAISKAIGPLRVDWTFDEIDGTTIQVLDVETGLYHKERTRTKSALEWTLDNLKTDQYPRKDTKRRCNYFNTPVAQGGVRPAAAADYFKAPFGHADGEELSPWKVALDTTRESILTVVHDALGQAADQTFVPVRGGRAGVYLRPSRIAGDGYQVRAQVCFTEGADWKLPNAAVLAKRYPLLPQTQSARLRVWRKSSIRGYFGWGNNNNWLTTVTDLRRHYKSCHVHLVNENGLTDAQVSMNVTDIWNPAVAAELQSYRDLVKGIVATTAATARLRTDANISLQADRMWPWFGLNDLGVRDLSPPNPAQINSAVFQLYTTKGNPYWYRLTCRLANEIADRLEKKHGRMRGHVIIEFRCTGEIFGRRYQCSSCGDQFGGCEKDATTTSHITQDCPSCSGPLVTDVWWSDNQCANGHSEIVPERSAASKSRDTQPCNTCASPQVFQSAFQAPVSWRVHTDFPVPSLGDPVGLSLNFNAGHVLWAHELGHNRYLEHAANAPGNNDAQHDATANPDATVSTYAAPSNRWDRACLMTYVSHLANYDAVKDAAFCCHKCVLKNRGWKLTGVPNPPAAVHDP